MAVDLALKDGYRMENIATGAWDKNAIPVFRILVDALYEGVHQDDVRWMSAGCQSCDRHEA